MGQLSYQNPTAFAFTDALLDLLRDAAGSRFFGDFLRDNDRDRVSDAGRAASVWAVVDHDPSCFANALYPRPSGIETTFTGTVDTSFSSRQTLWRCKDRAVPSSVDAGTSAAAGCGRGRAARRSAWTRLSRSGPAATRRR